MKSVAWWEWLGIAALVAVALLFRTRDLTLFKLSPDDGQYMNSARLQTLEQGGDVARWVREDVEWLGELREDWGNPLKLAETYQHSYLHQFLFRYGYRLGLSRIEALRTNTAVLGALTVAAVWALYAWLFPKRRAVGLVAAAILAVQLVHVFQSRTGWGQIGATFFFVVLFGLGWRLLACTREDDTRAQVRLGLALAAASVLAMGFQEMTSVLVIGLVLMALTVPWWRGTGGGLLEHWRSSRCLRAVLLAAVPVGAYTLCLRLFSEYAQEKWFTLQLYPDLSWWDLRVAVAKKFFTVDHLYAQISVPVLVLALWGAWSLRARDRAWMRWCVGWIGASTFLLFFVFNDPTLLRVYLPAMLVVVLLAAEGLVDLAQRAGPRLAPVAGTLGTAALASWLGAVSWTTVFGAEDELLFEPGCYVGIPRSRDADRPWIEYLEDHRVTDLVGVYPAKDPLFVALDHGFEGRLFSFEEPQSTWTDWLLAVNRSMELERRRAQDGGRYALVTQDRSGRIGLYRLEPPQ